MNARLSVTHSRCQCAACSKFFNSVTAFEMHREGPWSDRRCLSEDEMRQRGMCISSGGYWITRLREPTTDA